jgi:hypothetical protein
LFVHGQLLLQVSAVRLQRSAKTGALASISLVLVPRESVGTVAIETAAPTHPLCKLTASLQFFFDCPLRGQKVKK